MAVVQVRKSDKSGDEIPDGTGARVRITFYDSRKTDRRADLTDAEVEELFPYTSEVEERPARRGEKRRARI